MSSRRDLRGRAWDAERRALSLETQLSDTRARYENALAQVATHHGFRDAYVRTYTDYWGGYTREFFDTDALIADLDTIDKATAADEARKRLGIKEEA